MSWEKYIRNKIEKTLKENQKEELQNISSNDLQFNYRLEHNELVLSIGMEMGKKLDADTDILKAAILLHDIGRSVVHKGHGETGAQMAEEILKNTDFPQEKIGDVKYAIVSHVGWDESVPETLEARILWDADKLSKLGASIILQKAMRMPLQGKTTLEAVSEFNEWLETAEYIKEHMKTALGSEMARRRYETLKSFVTALNKETDPKR